MRKCRGCSTPFMPATPSRRRSSCPLSSACGANNGGKEPIMLSTAPIRAYIPASNVARARKFYEQTIVLRPKQEYSGGVIYECGGAEVFLYPTSNAGTSTARQAYWQVADVEAEVAELKARGVKFDEYNIPGVTMKNSIATAGGAKTAWFKDTEGNILAVS